MKKIRQYKACNDIFQFTKRSFLQNISKGKYDSREIDLKRVFFKPVNQKMMVKNVESGLKYISEIAAYFT